MNILERKSDNTVGKSGKIAVYILTALERTQSGRKPLDEVRSQIERTLASQIEAESHSKWLSRLKKDAYVRISLPNRPSFAYF